MGRGGVGSRDKGTGEDKKGPGEDGKGGGEMERDGKGVKGWKGTQACQLSLYRSESQDFGPNSRSHYSI